MKLLVSLNSKSLEDYLDYTNSFIIGLKNFSINYLELRIDEIKDLLHKYPDINLFVSINKNIFNDELPSLENALLALSSLPISGLFFYDLSLLSLCQKLNVSIPLVLNQTHMVTSYSNCNYYYDKGVSYAYLSSDITKDEIIEIKEHTKMKLMVLFMGYPAVSHSKRHLVSNYFKYKNIPDNKEYHTFKTKDSENYIIKEDDKGTVILYGNILNGAKYLEDLSDYIEYGILDENLIDHALFIKVLSLYKELLETKDKALLLKINTLIGEDTVFFDKKTFYKVKRNEKN